MFSDQNADFYKNFQGPLEMLWVLVRAKLGRGNQNKEELQWWFSCWRADGCRPHSVPEEQLQPLVLSKKTWISPQREGHGLSQVQQVTLGTEDPLAGTQKNLRIEILYNISSDSSSSSPYARQQLNWRSETDREARVNSPVFVFLASYIFW